MARTAPSPAGPQGLAPPVPTLPARRHRHRLLLLVGLPVRLSSPLLVMLSALFLSTYLFLCSLPSCQHAAETLPTGGGSEGGGSGAAAAAAGGGGIGVTVAVEEGRVSGRRGGAASSGGAGSEGRAAMAWSAAAAGDEDEEDSIQAPPLSRRGYASQSSGGGGGGGGRREEGGDGGGEGLARGSKTPHAARAHGSAKTRERGSGLRALQEMSENNEDDGGAAAGIQHNEKTKRNVDDDVDVDDDVADGDNADLGKEEADEVERRDGGQVEESELGIPCCKRLPQALIIGVKKGGTRALLEALRLHPAVRALGAEAHFFDRNYERGLEWYRGLMPPTEPGQITMEKTPSYFVTREAPARIRAMGGGRTKLLVVVRDPVTRAVSDYAQTLAKRPRGTPPFRRLAFRNGSAAAEPVVEPRWSALRIGLYARHLERWLRHFPRESMLFVSGERLATRPAAELARVQDFLGIARLVTRRHFYFNATKGFPCLRRGGIAAAAAGAAAAGAGAAAATDGLSVGDRGARLRGSGSARKVGRRIARATARMRGRGGSWTYGDVGDVDVDVGDVGDEEAKQNEREDEEEEDEEEVERRDSGEEDGDAEAVEDDEYDERGEWAGGDGEENHWGQPHCLGNSKGRPHPHIEPELLQRLREFYRPFNLKFYQMVGQDFGWD